MALQLEFFDVSNIVLGNQTMFEDGTLTLDHDRLREHLMEDDHFEDITLHVAHPGDSLRVINVVDVVEPRCRLGIGDHDYPGFLSSQQTVGEGRTAVMRGAAVVEVSKPVPGESIYWREAFFDMTETCKGFSPFSDLANLIIEVKPAKSIREDDRPPLNVFEGTPEAVSLNRAIRAAGLKASVFMASAAADSIPDEIVNFELPLERNPDLPGVVYLYQLSIPYLYGEIVPGGGAIGGSAHLPTLVHPNEILDGALVLGWNAIACMRELTYIVQNHPIISDLYERSGTDLEFLGVVLFANGDTPESKERLTGHATTLARLLNPDGAVINYAGGGHPCVDTMMICQKLEKTGIPTTVLSMEMAPDPSDSGFVHFVREADAIVSTGNYEECFEFHDVESVIGGTALLNSDSSPYGPFSYPLSGLLGSTNQFGFTNIRARTH
jgi:glycine reductase complex component B subunit alpha and beta